MRTITWTEEKVEQFTADVKAALAKYPGDKARIHKAALLVLDKKFEFATDGTLHIQNSSGTGTYLVNGHCECLAAQHGTSRCAHRWAKAFIARLAEESAVIDCDAFIRETQGGHASMAAHVCDPSWRAQRELAGHSVTAGK